MTLFPISHGPANLCDRVSFNKYKTKSGNPTRSFIYFQVKEKQMYWEDTDRQIINGVTDCIDSNHNHTGREHHVINFIFQAREKLSIFLGNFDHSSWSSFLLDPASVRYSYFSRSASPCNAMQSTNSITYNDETLTSAVTVIEVPDSTGWWSSPPSPPRGWGWWGRGSGSGWWPGTRGQESESERDWTHQADWTRCSPSSCNNSGN